MPAPNYKQSEVTGTQWQRAIRVVIENPFGGVPSINFVEETATQLGDSVITQPCSNLTCDFDVSNPAHVEIYDKLNALYMALAEIRDSAQSSAEPQP